MKGDGKGIFDGHKVFSRKSSEASLEDNSAMKSPSLEEGIGMKEMPPTTSGNTLKKRLNRFSPVALVKRLGGNGGNDDNPKKGLGTLSGVLIPTCENMWGVLIFLRFYYVVGNAGVWQSFLVVFISFLCAVLTTMSLSAIATNGPIEEGGTYYLISRALGPKLGGSVGFMYYLGVSLLAVLESLGAVEMLLFTFPSLKFVSANRVLGAIILCFLCFLVYFGISFVSKLSLVFFAVVLYTMLSYYLGLFTAPGKKAPDNMTGLSWNTFKGNWNSGYSSDASFSVVLAVFFPCFTGILSGADRAKALARPEKSIPAGTIGAVCISLVMYLSYMGLWAAVGTRGYLLGELPDGSQRGHGGGHGNLDVVVDVAFPLAILTQLGIIIASMAQAFQCLITSPRLLQAIAGDGVIPFLGRVAKTSTNGEPRAALLATTVLCVLAAMIGSLDAVAPLVSICFLSCYSALNFSCVVLSMLKAPSWRPMWKYYHWSFALLGFILCFGMNFAIKWYWAIAAVALLVALYIYIDYRQVEVDWGTGLGGLRLQLAVQSILAVGHEARYSVNWRPQLLCLCKPRSARSSDDHDNQEFLSFVSQLKKGRGLCVMATILEGKLEKMGAQVDAERLELENCMQAANVTGFTRVLVAPSYKEGKTYAIQSSGLGGLEPNTLVLGWPNNWREDEHYHNSEVMLEILTECKAVDKAVLLCMNLDEFPTSGAQQEGSIDVWWIVHDGGLLLMLAHLLQQHRVWRKCKLRVYTVAENVHDPAVVKRNLRKLLDQVRIQADVQVLELDETGLAPYTFDYTIRLEERRAFVEEIAHYRMAQEDRKKALEQNAKTIRRPANQPAGRTVEQILSPMLARTKSGERETLDNIFKDIPPTMHNNSQNVSFSGPLPTDSNNLADKSAVTYHSTRYPSALGSGRLEPGSKQGSTRYVPDNLELGKHELLAKQQSEVLPKLDKSKSGRSIEQILKKSVPTELSMLDGVPHQPRPRSGPLHALKMAGNGDAQSLDGESTPTEGGRLEESEFKETLKPIQAKHETFYDEKQTSRKETANSAIQKSTMPSTSLLSPSTPKVQQLTGEKSSTQQRVGKETRWADDCGQGLRRSDSVEINVDARSEDDSETPGEGGSVKPLTRMGSAGQLYPGSPHHSMSDFGDVDAVIPETNRTWETFSQSYSPKKLNDMILEHSKNAQLVLLNLPDHYHGMEPETYMQYCENLTEGLRRVLLVHGSGKELWNSGA
ncbi:protein MpCCC2 [Marchantia polymorpha subsp. ruderalis]|uniref:Amino acid permease/ SLC12A domain-containing protein n=2 Tax=Marchantia polymorpha TaxID=3197 RepID=A0AAF6BDF2_MARPO|nr:hypothetical protein MARPO_0078s0036 [Marchantia polymorpha]PTQ34630.1 hypothetical protein MARPO_0078s0036 [Marchantia polymorpha]BBN10036.1 hypothetical protein Mp_5g00360 [Marchantia polymorpha subsp. ruderalis]BBN10037.1 hypothetical protein Mp_5g00360 [Marchantia polymorpha subsp. ruderalis]|eukprot:PTQ34629.1 hypothetical protein MARPO_0078s0036 [Marchantia polymorpha]